jgi:membrane fusion protein (multidrug efflux system)
MKRTSAAFSVVGCAAGQGLDLASETINDAGSEDRHELDVRTRSDQQPARADQSERRPGTVAESERDDSGPPRGDDGQKPARRWPLYILAAVVVLAIIGGVVYWFLTRDLESTDDAYTDGNAIAFAAKVSGYVTQLNIDDNMFVHAGDLLLKIDPRDYTTARDQARASLSLARAQRSSAQVDLDIARVRVPANLQQAKAQLEQAKANQAQAERDYRRQRAVDPRATTQTNVDQATAQMQSTNAAVSNADAQVQIASLVQQNIQAAEEPLLHHAYRASRRHHYAAQRRSRHLRAGRPATVLHCPA